MLILRYLSLEVIKSQLAVFIVLITIFMSQKFVRILADASEGEIPGQLVAAVIILHIPQLTGLILPLSVFVGVLLAYGRIYADSEMTVLHASGVSEWYVVRVTLILSIFYTIIVGFFTLYLAPLAAEYEYQVKEKVEADAGLSTLIAGRFQETANHQAVLFVQQVDRKSKALQQVFVAQFSEPDELTQQTESHVTYAKTGKIIEQADGSQQLILESGHRYQGLTNHQDYEVINFSKYQIQVVDQAVEHKRRKLSAYSSIELWQEKEVDAIAEMQWRLAIPFSIPILILIAVPLSAVNPREGRYAKLLPAIGIYLIYYVLLVAARSGIEEGKITHALGLGWIHLSVALIGIVLILRGRRFGLNLRAKLFQ